MLKTRNQVFDNHDKTMSDIGDGPKIKRINPFSLFETLASYMKPIIAINTSGAETITQHKKSGRILNEIQKEKITKNKQIKHTLTHSNQHLVLCTYRDDYVFDAFDMFKSKFAHKFAVFMKMYNIIKEILYNETFKLDHSSDSHILKNEGQLVADSSLSILALDTDMSNTNICKYYLKLVHETLDYIKMMYYHAADNMNELNYKNWYSLLDSNINPYFKSEIDGKKIVVIPSDYKRLNAIYNKSDSADIYFPADCFVLRQDENNEWSFYFDVSDTLQKILRKLLPNKEYYVNLCRTSKDIKHGSGK